MTARNKVVQLYFDLILKAQPFTAEPAAMIIALAWIAGHQASTTDRSLGLSPLTEFQQGRARGDRVRIRPLNSLNDLIQDDVKAQTELLFEAIAGRRLHHAHDDGDFLATVDVVLTALYGKSRPDFTPPPWLLEATDGFDWS